MHIQNIVQVFHSFDMQEEFCFKMILREDFQGCFFPAEPDAKIVHFYSKPTAPLAVSFDIKPTRNIHSEKGRA